MDTFDGMLFSLFSPFFKKNFVVILFQSPILLYLIHGSAIFFCNRADSKYLMLFRTNRLGYN